MQSTDSRGLLRQYAETESEEAFAALVTQHVHLVHSVALRQVGDPHHAEEITQAVFIILAKKARQLRHEKALSSWLFQTTRLTANNFVRSEMRRHHREQQSCAQSALQEASIDIWQRIAPMLDEAVAALGEKDRRAIILRYYEGRDLRQVGAALGTTDDAAGKRVARALEKLRRFFSKRGASSTTAILVGAISTNSVQAAPEALAATVIALAAAKGSTASGSTLVLIKGALKIMAWTKAKTAIVAGACVLLTAGIATVAVDEIQKHSTWRVEGFHSEVLNRQPAQVGIFPSKLHGEGHGWGLDGKMMGTGARPEVVVSMAYGFWTLARTIVATDLPGGRYDFIASLRNGRNAQALQREVARQFGVVARTETRTTNVFVLTVKSPNAPGLKPSTARLGRSWMDWDPGRCWLQGRPLGCLTACLELYANIPVVDGTGLTNNFDLDLHWKQTDLQAPNLADMKQSLINQLGLELVPTNMPIKMLVVEKAKD